MIRPTSAGSSASRPRPAPREVRVEEIVDQFSGGTQSLASVAIIDGEKKFLRSQKCLATGYGRYANFESDLLAHDLFDLIGLKSPETEVVRLAPDSPLRKELGAVVLSMDFVDSQYVGRQKVAAGAWGLREGAVLDDYLKMTVVDILLGNADRRGANYIDRWTSHGKVHPVPIDNNSGVGNLVNWKTATNHCNFIPSYDGAGSSPGLRQAGTIANIFLDTTLHAHILDEPHEQKRMLEIARDFTSRLTDEKIDEMVEKLPREIIPRGVKVSKEFLKPRVEADTVEALANGASEGLSGKELYEFRKNQIRHTLAWRRDHLVEALEKFFQAKDPVRAALDDWNLMGQQR